MKQELTLIETSLCITDIPEVLGNGIRVEEIQVLDFDNFLKDFSL